MDFRFWKKSPIMGILNVTPDSFSDGGAHCTVKSAVDAGVRMVEDGAGCIDIGGESTRPGSTPVPLEEELRRVMPVIRQLKTELGEQAVLSIDTTKPQVALQALDAGVDIVNDVSGMSQAVEMCTLLQQYRCGYVLMHSGPLPNADGMVAWYVGKVAEACQLGCGIVPEQFIFDGGIGFHSGCADDLKVMGMIPRLKRGGLVVLVGASRKSWLGAVTGRNVDSRLAGSVSAVALCRHLGADIFRVHDVAQSLDACRVAEVIGESDVFQSIE